MKNELSTKLYYVDYNYIRNNYMDKKLWNKTWTLYDYGKLKVTMKIYAIYVYYDEVSIEVRVEYAGDKRHNYDPYSDYNWIRVPLNNPEYTNKLFQQKLYGETTRIIDCLESNIIRELKVYKEEEKRVGELQNMLRETAKHFLDDHDIKDKSFRDAYISAFVAQNTTTMFSMIEERFKGKILTKERLLWASFNKKPIEKYEEILKGKRVSKSSITVWLQKQKDKKFDYTKLLPDLKTEGA